MSLNKTQLFTFCLCLVVLLPLTPVLHSEKIVGELGPAALKQKRQKIANQLGKILFLGGDHLGYAREYYNFLRNQYNILPDNQHQLRKVNRKRFGRTRGPELDLYSMLTGGLAIRESLQLDSLRPSQKGEATIPLADLKGPSAPAHPFKKMLKGRTFKFFPLSAFAPEDFYYVHFINMERAFNFFDYLNDVGGSMYKRATPKSVNFKLKDKILEQLALIDNPSNRKFYRYVILGAAMIGSDPFLLNGSDLTLILKVKNDLAFNNRINSYRTKIGQRRGAKKQTIMIQGRQAELLSTPDRRVHSILLRLKDGIAMISNSKKALEAALDARAGKRTSMARANDFKYMRSIYEADKKTEDAFVFLSDAFIRRLTGPELRIKEARRMREALRLASLERAGIYYYQIHDRHANSLEDMRGDFSAARLKKYAGLELVSGSFAARSKEMGQVGFLKPNLEYEMKYVTQAEASAYKAFLKNYNSYWRNYFDPIGIRVKLTGKRTRIETTILPLINNSIYNSVTELFGGKSVGLRLAQDVVPGEIFSLAVKLNKKSLDKDKDFKKFVQKFMGGSMKNFKLDDVLGDEIQIHVMDTEPLVDFDAGIMVSALRSRNPRLSYLFIGGLVWSLFHPLRFSVPLKDEQKAQKLLNIAEEAWAKIAPEFDADFRIDRYFSRHNNQKIRVLKLSLADILKFRLYYTIDKGLFHMTTTRKYMEKVLDYDRNRKPDFLSQCLAPASFFKEKKSKISKSSKGNILALYRPKQISKERDLFVFNMLESAKDASFRNSGSLLLFSKIFPGQNTELDSQKSFGFNLECPAGGVYSIDPQSGEISNSVFGKRSAPYLDLDKVKDSSIHRFFSTKSISLSLSFTREGLQSVVDIE